MKNQEATKLTQMLLATNCKEQAAIRARIDDALNRLALTATQAAARKISDKQVGDARLCWIDALVAELNDLRNDLAKTLESERTLRLVLDGLQLGE